MLALSELGVNIQGEEALQVPPVVAVELMVMFLPWLNPKRFAKIKRINKKEILNLL